MSPWSSRLAAFRAHPAAEPLDAVVITAPVNVAYLTGFHGSSGWLVVTSGDARLITDGRYEGLVRQGLAEGTIGPVKLHLVRDTYDRALAEVAADLGAESLGFEGGHVTVSTLARWERAITGRSWRATDGLVEGLRSIKDVIELAVMRRAGALLAATASRLGEWVAAGRSERAIARDIDRALVDAGFERTAFETIVASGPNSAYPHARPTDRCLTRGDLVVLDFGGVLEGYCVDLTRMAGIGQIGPEVRNLFDTVTLAQQTAIRAVRAGVSGEDVDRAARDCITGRGLGPAFCHGTGHGLGLEVHEAPRVSRPSDSPSVTLQAGMVCTIEPGVYVDGLGGVRLEDDVVVTTEGCEVLTDVTRDLLVV